MSHAARIEPLEPRLQLSASLAVQVKPASATGGELTGPSSIAFGDLAVGDDLNNEQVVTITNIGSQSVQLDNPYSHDTNQVTVDTSSFPAGGFLDPGSSASFDVIANTNANLTINTIATVEYNDGADEFLDMPVTGVIGQGSDADTTPPTAKITYAKALRVNAKYYYFAVTYTDDTAVDTSTLDDNDILVSRRKYPTLHALLISDTSANDGASVTAVYAVRYGRTGLWTSAYDGLWAISLAKGQVADTSGNTAAGVSLGVVGFEIPTAKAAAVVRPAAAAAAAATQSSSSSSSSLFSTAAVHGEAVWDDVAA